MSPGCASPYLRTTGRELRVSGMDLSPVSHYLRAIGRSLYGGSHGGNTTGRGKKSLGGEY